jgi:DNA-binding NtrC family response regulator
VVLNSKSEVDAEDIQLGDGAPALPPEASIAPGGAAVFELRGFLKDEIARTPAGEVFEKVVGTVEKEVIRILLNQNQFNKRKTAEALGLNRVTLDKKIQQYGLFEI